MMPGKAVDYAANHAALTKMGWPMAAPVVPDFMTGMCAASEIDLRKALHRLKHEQDGYGGQEYKIRALEKEIVRRERAVGTL